MQLMVRSLQPQLCKTYCECPQIVSRALDETQLLDSVVVPSSVKLQTLDN